MVDVFKQLATEQRNRDELKIFENTSANSEAQSLRACPGIPSGPCCLPGVDVLEGASHISRLQDEWLTVSDWSWSDGLCLHLKAAKENIKFFCHGVTAAGQAVVLVLPSDLSQALSCPVWVLGFEVMLDPLSVRGFSFPDASPQVRSAHAVLLSVIRANSSIVGL